MAWPLWALRAAPSSSRSLREAGRCASLSRATTWAISLMEIEPVFISIGCNRVVYALDWGPGGHVAYGGHNVIAIYDPKVSHGVLQTLQKIMPFEAQQMDPDLYPLTDRSPVQAAQIVSTLLGHEGRVNCIRWIPIGKKIIPISLLESGLSRKKESCLKCCM